MERPPVGRYLQVGSTLELFEKALNAYQYYYPRKRPHGRGQAEGTLYCGHIGWSGAPCCKPCADKLIDAALRLV